MTYYSAPEVPTMIAGETLLGAIDCSNRLRSGETLGGTPTITEATSSVTISSVAVTTAAWTIMGSTVIAGQAVTFLATCSVGDADYDLVLSSTTSAGQTIKERIRLRVES